MIFSGNRRNGDVGMYGDVGIVKPMRYLLEKNCLIVRLTFGIPVRLHFTSLPAKAMSR